MGIQAEFSRAGKIEARLDEMASNSRNSEAWLKRVFLNEFYQAQLNRWQSENSSEGSKWKPLNKVYAERKVKTYGGYPGGGKALMIATGKLVNAVTGRGSGLNQFVSDRSITLKIDLGEIHYAKYAADARPFMEFKRETFSRWKKMYSDYIRGRK